ncbi:TPR repeat region circular [Carpediemonas membranifera]|uniref:TPR repeat region circular n=1 Tax=Carpediemonas membranifera TaxID=201153 RepID=A0A8J6ASW9_9EUKA|nr:TPR repeat region circular [Carpediemonas membranifera]|eukprot:KAG9391565.1 TPR repeat region circular [Carpediemonas membranifera]
MAHLGDVQSAYKLARRAMDLDPDNSDYLKIFRPITQTNRKLDKIAKAMESGKYDLVVSESFEGPDIIKISVERSRCQAAVKSTHSGAVSICTTREKNPSHTRQPSKQSDSR